MRTPRLRWVGLWLGLVPLAARAAEPHVELFGAPVATDSAEAAALARFTNYARRWQLPASTLALFRVVEVRTLVAGGIRVDLCASFEGRDIEDTDVHVLLTDELRPVSVSVGPAVPRIRARRGSPGTFTADDVRAFAPAPRVDPILVVAEDGSIVDAWRVRTDTKEVDVDARTGLVLRERTLTADAVYSVYADDDGWPADSAYVDLTPTDAAPDDFGSFEYVPAAIREVDGLDPNPEGGVDPWLPDGATTLDGNNAYAVLSWDDVNGTPIAATAADEFLATLDPTVSVPDDPSQRQVAATNAFYVVNWLHDLYYGAGFDEVAGNAQADNHGRGGVEGDALRIQLESNWSAGSVNNASMTTPGDGLTPTLRLYVRTGRGTATFAAGEEVPLGQGAFGAQGLEVAAPLVEISGACEEPVEEAVAGAIALFRRSGCPFVDRARMAQDAGAVALLIVDSEGVRLLAPTADVESDPGSIQIPIFAIRAADEALVDTALENGEAITLTGTPLGDMGLDSSVVAHEFGHMLHYRSVSELMNTQQEAAMSEGWGDTVALAMLLRDGDPLDGAYPYSQYGGAALRPDARYYGTRRTPYSRDLGVDGLTFRYITEGAGVPDGALDDGDEFEAHNAGEVWASALWDAYTGLQEASATSFEDTREHWAALIVSAMEATPGGATYLDGRDAVIAAAAAASLEEAGIVAQAFAGRGMGSCAEGPDRDSTDLRGVVEDFEVRPAPLIADVVVEETDGCDGDGVLDVGESGRVVVTIRNDGLAAMRGATLTVTSSEAGFVMGGAVTVPDVAPWEEVVVELPVEVDAAGDPELDVRLVSDDACADVEATAFVTVDQDVTPQASSTDSFDALPGAWSGEDGWTATPGAWVGVDADVATDARLVSPVLHVEGELRLHVEHAWSFQDVLGDGVDGGVIELRVNGGEWQDLSTWADPGYPSVIAADSSAIDGRPAFSGDSDGYPELTALEVDLGDALVGRSVELGFRVATDASIGGEGWTIGEVRVDGVGTPFPEVEDDPHACVAEEPSGCGCATTRPVGSGVGLFGLLMLLRRRR